MTPRSPHVLTIAGSDPSGGAGIQADLKTFSALGAYGMAALTALTAQNTRGVIGVELIDPEFVAEQIDAVFADIRVDAVKIGMIGSAASAARVADCLERLQPELIVLDPVMVAKSGDRLVDDHAVEVMRERLMPRATLITPNLGEAGVLLGQAPPATEDDMPAAAQALVAAGASSVLLKGGHLSGSTSRDLFVDGTQTIWLAGQRVQTGNSHGTGCTLASAVAALGPVAPSLESAARAAKAFLTASLEQADTLDVGTGHGPVHHFHRAWQDDPARYWLARAARAA